MASANAPGAAASSVVPCDLWSSLHAFLQGDVELHASLQASVAASPCGPSFARSLTELALPLPDVQRANPSALPLVALVFDALLAEAFHHVSRGPSCSPFLRQHSRGLAAPVSRGWLRLSSALQQWDEFPQVTPAEMGRAATKMDKVELQLHQLELVHEAPLSSALSNLHLAKDIEVSRLSLPKEPPGFDPCPYMDRQLRDLYMRPSCHSVPLREAPLPPPKVKVRASCRAEKLELLAVLDLAGRLKLNDAAAVDLSKACGLFALPKSLESDRLIVDGRPANLCSDLDGRWLSMLAAATSAGG